MLTRSQSLRTAISLAIQSREKNTTGLVALIGNHIEIWIHSSELDSPERCRSGVLRSGERRSSSTVLEIRNHGSGNSNEGLTVRRQIL